MAQDVQAQPISWSQWPDPVLQWNAVMLATVGGKNAVEQQRIAAIAHLAVFEAVNAITRGYEPYLGAIVATPDASAEAAAIAAAHAVLLHYIPEQAATLDAARASSLARIPDGPAKDAGIGIGEAAATAMIDQRVNDGSQIAGVPRAAVDGSRRMAAHVQLPATGRTLSALAERGALRHRAQRSIPRGSSSIAHQPEVREGLQRSEGRSVRSTARTGRPIAPTWRASTRPSSDFRPGMSAAQQVAVAQKRSLSENARAFALLNMALFDATIAVFETKYHETFWRPETAIPAADVDDNPKTDPDPSFKPFITTPCHPSYPSAHASLGGAARRVLERVYGKGPHAIELASPAVPDVRLRYASFEEITSDIDDARIYGGIHFRFDQQAGARQGRQVGSYIVRHHLRPARHDAARDRPAPTRRIGNDRPLDPSSGARGGTARRRRTTRAGGCAGITIELRVFVHAAIDAATLHHGQDVGDGTLGNAQIRVDWHECRSTPQPAEPRMPRAR